MKNNRRPHSPHAYALWWSAVRSSCVFAAMLSVLGLAAHAQDFSISSLSSANATVIEVNSLTGDDRGGIAVSGTHVFLTGDAATARFARGTLSGGTGLGVIRDSLVSDLRTEKVYLLANGTTPVTPKDVGGTVVINSESPIQAALVRGGAQCAIAAATQLQRNGVRSTVGCCGRAGFDVDPVE